MMEENLETNNHHHYYGSNNLNHKIARHLESSVKATRPLTLFDFERKNCDSNLDDEEDSQFYFNWHSCTSGFPMEEFSNFYEDLRGEDGSILSHDLLKRNGESGWRDSIGMIMDADVLDSHIYSTVVKQNNCKYTRRFLPPTEVSFRTAINNCKEEDFDTTSTVRDFHTVASVSQMAYEGDYDDIDFDNSKSINREKDSIPTPPSSPESSSSPSVRDQISLTSLPIFDLLSDEGDSDFEIGSLIEVRIKSRPLYGVIKWIGELPDMSGTKRAGIELDEELSGAGNGYYNEKEYFSCSKSRGIFIQFSQIGKDKRFEDSDEDYLSEAFLYESHGNRDKWEMKDAQYLGVFLPLQEKDLSELNGCNRGIQGYRNSCYLDATLFAMFTFTSVFDCLLYRPPENNDLKEYSDVQRVLREEVVNPLRKNLFVRADRVMILREYLDSLFPGQGFISEEKDPEELLDSLLRQALNATPFLNLSSGQSSYTFQLFVERDESRITPPTVQELFEQSFRDSAIQLRKMPSVLILQMPRFGRQFKVYDRILPTLQLDVTDIIETAPRQCIICGNLAVLECPSCFGEHGAGLDSVAFCRDCHHRTHIHKDRQNHTTNALKISSDLLESSDSHSRLRMELFAVLCIETSHYVAFAKADSGPSASWCLFDSMADRKGEKNGFNIPEVTMAPDILRYFASHQTKRQSGIKNDDPIDSEHVKRLICDGYMYFYQCKEVMMYQ